MNFRDFVRQLNEEDKGEEIESKDPCKIWHYTSNLANSYYSVYTKSKSITKSFDDIKDLVAEANACKSSNIISDRIIETYETETPQNPAQELPNGIYRHEYGSSSLPERIIPMSLRQDKYLDLMDSLVNLNESVNDFLNNRELYESSCSAYKLGVLLFGPPGTGKTTYIREFARKHDAIIIFLDGVPGRDFLSKIESSTKDRLKIFIFEEAVSMLENSDDIRDMLDFLDGSMSVSNAIYFLSTNYPESIPENVIRNGRIDLFIRVEFPSKEARSKLIPLYIQRDASEEELATTASMPIVDIREICFLHKKTNKSFSECAKIVEEKNKMLKKHFGKSREIRLA